ncbi:hypothetical protein [Cellulomonas soli]
MGRTLRWGLVTCAALLLGAVLVAAAGQGPVVAPGSSFTVLETAQTWANGQRVQVDAVRDGTGEDGTTEAVADRVEVSVGDRSGVLSAGQTLWVHPWGGLTVESIEPMGKGADEVGPSVQVKVTYRVPVWFTAVAVLAVLLAGAMVARRVARRRGSVAR